MPIDFNLPEMSQRMRSLRVDLGISPEEIAEFSRCTVEDYLAMEAGKSVLPFSALYKIAEKLGVDLTDLLTGDRPTLSSFTFIRRGEGLPVIRRHGFEYENLAYLFKNRVAEPLFVTVPYDPEDEKNPIPLSSHPGQEFDYVLSGTLRVSIAGHEEDLNAGDCVYYDSSKKHGMIAVGGKDATFLAIVLKTEA